MTTNEKFIFVMDQIDYFCEKYGTDVVRVILMHYFVKRLAVLSMATLFSFWCMTFTSGASFYIASITWAVWLFSCVNWCVRYFDAVGTIRCLASK